jgi:hypothetical protein
MKRAKHEARSTKYETNPNDGNPNDGNVLGRAVVVIGDRQTGARGAMVV